MKSTQDLWNLLPLIIILLGSLTLVRAADLLPLPNATVTVSGDNGDGSSITGSDGTFTISHGLGEGNYTVDVGHQGYISAKIDTTITAGAETNIGDVQLMLSGRIQGVIEGSSGNPVSGVSVFASNELTNQTAGFGVTSGDGSFTLDTDIQTGTYTVQAAVFGQTSFAGYSANKTSGIAVTAGETTSGVIVTLGTSGTISGTVKDNSNAPISNVSIYATPRSGFDGLFFGGSATTDLQGQYSIASNLPTGEYSVSVFGATGFVFSFGESENTTVTAGQTSTVDFVLQRSGIISGAVTLTGGGAAPNITVSAFTTSVPFYSGSATTGINGQYRIESGLGTGEYMVYASGDFLNHQTVNVTAGAETSNVDFQITAPSLAYISGTVRNSTGGAIAFADLGAEGQDVSGSGSTDGNGNYASEIDMVQAQASVNVTAYASGYVPSSQIVTVNLGQTTSGVDFTLDTAPTGTLIGRVVVTVVIPEFPEPAILLSAFAISALLLILVKRRSNNSHLQRALKRFPNQLS